MLDAKNDVWAYIKAFGRAVLMLAYNYPFFLIGYAVLRLLIAGGYLLTVPLITWVPQLAVVGWALLILVVIPYWICFITNFYVKRLHEQYTLYYAK